MAAFEPEKRLVTEAGYGIAARYGEGDVTPYAGLSSAKEGGRTELVGARRAVLGSRACTSEGTEARPGRAPSCSGRSSETQDSGLRTQDSSTSKVQDRSADPLTSSRLSRFRCSSPAPVSMFQRLKVVSTSRTGQ